MKYVTLGNGVVICIDIEDVEQIFDEDGCVVNDFALDYAEDNAEFWLWDIGNIELPADHRYSIEAIEKYRMEM